MGIASPKKLHFSWILQLTIKKYFGPAVDVKCLKDILDNMVDDIWLYYIIKQNQIIWSTNYALLY